MKKLLVLLVSAALVLSMAAVSMAEIKFSGEVSNKYSFHDGVDSYEVKLTADAKVNDNLSTKVVLKSKGGDVFVDEWNFTYKTFADLQVGFFPYEVYGEVDVIDYAFGDLKAEAGVALTKELDNGFNLGLWYAADYCDEEEVNNDNAYALNIGYANDNFDVDLYVIDTAFNGYDLSYSVTAALTIWEGITPYVAYADDDADAEESLILGALFEADALEVRAEYDFEDDVKGEDYFGIKAKYTFASGIYAQYTYTSIDGDTEKDEIKVGVKFK